MECYNCPPIPGLPPYRDLDSHNIALKTGDLHLVRKAAKSNLPNQHAVRDACYMNFIEAAKFYLDELKVFVTKHYEGKCVGEATRHGNKELFEYLTGKGFGLDRVAENVNRDDMDDKGWDFCIDICEKHNLSLPLWSLRTFYDINETRFDRLLKAGAPREIAVRKVTSKIDLITIRRLLDFKSPNYDAPEEREELLEAVFAEFIYDKDNLDYTSIVQLLIDRKFFDGENKDYVVKSIGSELTYEQLRKYKSTIGDDKWNAIFDNDTSLLIFNECLPYIDKELFEKCSQYALDEMNLCRCTGGLAIIIAYLEKKYGQNWTNQISRNCNDSVIIRTSNTYVGIHNQQIFFLEACQRGFKVYRSIFRDIGYLDFLRISKYCLKHEIQIEEDVKEEVWKAQVKAYEQHTFKNNMVKIEDLDQRKIYHVRVFGWGIEKKGDDGLWREEILYDIPIAWCLKTIKNGMTMRGSNNGLITDRNCSEGESEWIDQVKNFHLVNSSLDRHDPIIFYTGRDGGSLNCWGQYYVRIKENIPAKRSVDIKGR